MCRDIMSTIKDPAYPPSEHSGSNEIKFKEESSFKKYIKIVIIALLALLLLAAIIAVIVLAVKLNQEYSKEGEPLLMRSLLIGKLKR